MEKAKPRGSNQHQEVSRAATDPKPLDKLGQWPRLERF
jgi:hypothetical protein